ncbi:MAG: DUF2834 domain-containing protein [Deltaproteobacteria bacterium]|jgi:hypothetical protein|nr:DUF2834 domain-containing protein [Deltaproteobacteria bacterium]
MGYFYLGLALLGAVVPYAFLGQFLQTTGLDLAAFKAQAVASHVSAYFAANMLVSMIVAFCFIWGEGKRLKMRGLWLPTLATLGIGVSCGLPLFLYLRKQVLERPPVPAPEPPPERPRGAR